MESLINKINNFLSYGDGYGDGYGNGYGYGNGNSYGNGNGYGYGNGNGNGCGNGNGNSYGYGFLYGSILNGNKIYNIDNVPTVIESVKGDFAKGFMVNPNLTLTPCYIAKFENVFAHGATIKEAYDALQEKLLENMPVEKRIERFLQEFKPGVMYPNKNFFDWHHILTGSCLFGRQQFVKNKGIDLDGEMTVEKFVKLTENDYGGETIKELKRMYKKWIR